MYTEINGVKFNITPGLYKNKKELQEAGIALEVAKGYNIFDEKALNKLVTSEFNVFDLISTFFKITRLLTNKEGNTLQKIQRFIYAIGPITLLLMYLMVYPRLAAFIRDIILTILRKLKIMGNVLTALIKLILKFIVKMSGSLFSVIILMILLPISAFMTTIGSLLIMGDKVAISILPPLRMKVYLRKIWNIFKKLGNGLIDLIPFARPVVNFIGTIFRKVISLFTSGTTQARNVVRDMERKSQEKTEGFNPITLILAPLGIFLMKLLKSTKMIGIFGIILILLIKFSARARSLLMKIPVINKIIPMLLSTGASFLKRLKFDKLSQALKAKQQELEQLKETVEVMNAVAH